MHENFIEIVNQKEVSPAFIKANLFLMEKFSDLFLSEDDIVNKKILEDLWLKEFNAVLIFDDATRHYSKICFENNKQKTLFLIRWG